MTPGEEEIKEQKLEECSTYAALMSEAQEAWVRGDLRRLREIIEETQAHACRGFEWYYWMRQTLREGERS